MRAIVQARSGVFSINGTSSDDLARVGVSLLDMGSGNACGGDCYREVQNQGGGSS